MTHKAHSLAIMEEGPVLDSRTFDKFCALIYEKAGIKLGEKKEALVQARLGKRMRALGMHDFKEYFQLVENDQR